jgi:hypothetical protein
MNSRKQLFQYLKKTYPHVSGKKNFFSNHPRKLWEKINVSQSTDNLLTTIDACEKLDIKYSLAFGTLLGIYRDGELIEHDTDSDLAVWLEDKNKIIEAIKYLEDKELKITRISSTIISFTRGGDYVDIYLYTKNFDNDELYCLKQFGTLTTMDFNNSNTVIFKDRELKCVHDPETYFQKLYGSNWRTPIKNKHANIRNGNK